MRSNPSGMFRTTIALVVAALGAGALSDAAPARAWKFDAAVGPLGTSVVPAGRAVLLKIGDGSLRRTTSELDLYLPRTLRLDLSGMPTCRLDERLRPTGACTTLGRISDANFELAVNYPPADRSRRRFSVVPIKTESPTTGKTVLGFVFYSGILPFSGYIFLAETTVKRVSGKYGQRLRIRLPRELVDSAGLDIYNALLSLQLKLGYTTRNRTFIVATGCQKRRHPFKVVLKFIDNTVTEAGTATRTAAAPCRK